MSNSLRLFRQVFTDFNTCVNEHANVVSPTANSPSQVHITPQTLPNYEEKIKSFFVEYVDWKTDVRL